MFEWINNSALSLMHCLKTKDGYNSQVANLKKYLEDLLVSTPDMMSIAFLSLASSIILHLLGHWIKNALVSRLVFID